MTSTRGPALTAIALLFVVLAVSNLMKPLEMSPEHGFVLLGRRLSGTANLIVAPIFGAFLLTYAAGIWGLRRWALPMGQLYVVYVVVNLVLFTFRTPQPADGGAGALVFGLGYAVVAIGVSVTAVRLLARRRAELV